MIDQLKIYFSEDNRLTELMIREKCWRGDVIVILESKAYQLEFITPERLYNEYLYAKQEKGFDIIYHPLIIVEETSKKEIIKSIKKLTLEDFQHMNALSSDSYPLNEIDEWTQVL